MAPHFTVFTATYNRAHTLPAVFQCLMDQTTKDFEWILVDDGSQDGTPELCREFEQKADFPMTVIRQKNSGKHVAQNRALDIAKGTLFVSIDSDDTMVSNALETFWEAWEQICATGHQAEFSGIGVHCMDQYGNRVGKPWPRDGMISNDLEMRFVYGIEGEKWGCLVTDVIRQYKNEEVRGHYLPESTRWFRIARKYKKVFLEKCLRTYEIHEDSISNAKQEEASIVNFEPLTYALELYINEFWSWWLRYKREEGLRMPLRLAKLYMLNGKPLFFSEDALIRRVHPMLARILIVLASPYQLVLKLKKRK